MALSEERFTALEEEVTRLRQRVSAEATLNASRDADMGSIMITLKSHTVMHQGHRESFLALQERLDSLETETRNGFRDIRGEMQNGFRDVRSEMQSGFAEERSKTEAGFTSLRGEMQAGFAQVNQALQAIADRLN